MFAYKGDKAVDDRGVLTFVNDFDFDGVQRFYTVTNFQNHFVRAWHGHLKEDKYVTVLRGAAIVAAFPFPINYGNIGLERVVLSAEKPSVLFIPRGYANGFMNLLPDTQMMYFSTATVKESKEDDYRFEANLFRHVWDVEER
jgi:dTDP-4-dehydrorhamnose 3,5-epimerase